MQLKRPQGGWAAISWGHKPFFSERWHAPPSLLFASDLLHRTFSNSNEYLAHCKRSSGGYRSEDACCASCQGAGRIGPPYTDAHVFCTARHPVCRTISEYRSVWSKPRHPQETNPNASRRGPQPRAWDSWLNLSLGSVGGPRPVQVHNLPVAPWYPCDTYLRFEHLQEDFSALLERWHFPRNRTLLPHISHARQLPVRVTNEQLSRIALTFADDLRRFNYSMAPEAIPCDLSLQ